MRVSDGQESLDLGRQQKGRVEEYKFEPIKGYPMLNWRGKRPFASTQFYPAQLKEVHGEEVEGWRNKIFWGDNIQVMSHLLKEFRGEISLIYIDPPFDSKADYKKNISLRGRATESDHSVFEDKQYSDIWNNDSYLQFMYERIQISRELLSKSGLIFLHCDWHKSHHLRAILDEIFGPENFVNEIIWVRSTNPKGSQHAAKSFSTFTDTIFIYGKTSESSLDIDGIRIPLSEEEIVEKYHRRDDNGIFYDGPMIRSMTMGERPNLVYEYKGYTPPKCGWRVNRQQLEEIDSKGNLGWSSTGAPFRKLRPEDDKGKPIGNIWSDISLINSQAEERVGYPTQKPLALLDRIIKCASKPNDIVFDFFMGSGTAQVAAMRLGRRFIGADINLGAITTTTKRLGTALGKRGEACPGFEVYSVNNYELFRNPTQAKELLLEALEIQPLEQHGLYDGEKDGRMIKIMPVNRIATKADLSELVSNFDQKLFQRRQDERPNQPVEKIRLVCMGHEPDLKAELELQAKPFRIDVEVVDILRDKSQLEFKRDSEAKIVIRDGELVIENFYPMNLLQKLSLQQEQVGEWRELVDSVMVDWNYDGAVLQPTVVDVPGKDDFVIGRYKVPADAGTVRVKITDLLSESWEGEING